MKRRDEGNQGEARELFERAMREVEPLPPDGPGRRDRRCSAVPAPTPTSENRRGKLRIEVDGEKTIGLAPGVDRRTLRRLRRGLQPVEMEVDLHGFTEVEARTVVSQALERAGRKNWKCLRIIHGRGHGSAAGPVLKRALPRWLAEAAPPVEVVAFTTAGPRLGGAGATLVLLRGS